MAKNEKRRQQKLLKKRRKEKAKRKERARAEASSSSHPKAAIRHARHYPIHECLLNPNWREMGIASILVARKQTDVSFIFGVYLVDVFCLGVKNAFCNANFPLSKYREFRERFVEGNDAHPCTAELAHQIIYGALDYAADLGFQPHEDFALSRCILEERDAVPPNPDLEFGQDGKPTYVSGPDDHVEAILHHLRTKLGEDKFHFIVGGPV